jgi:PAS domain-containing protein
LTTLLGSSTGRGRAKNRCSNGKAPRPAGIYICQEVILKKAMYLGREAVIYYGRDVSERKRAQKTLEESESKFRILADHAPVLLRMTNADNYFYYFSKQWLHFTGSTLKKEQDNGWLKNIHPEDRRPWWKNSNTPLPSAKTLRSPTACTTGKTTSAGFTKTARPTSTPTASSRASSPRPSTLPNAK